MQSRQVLHARTSQWSHLFHLITCPPPTSLRTSSLPPRRHHVPHESPVSPLPTTHLTDCACAFPPSSRRQPHSVNGVTCFTSSSAHHPPAHILPPPPDVSPIQADGSSAYQGVGLYEFACRASHSCAPNCFWYAGQVRRGEGGHPSSPGLTWYFASTQAVTWSCFTPAHRSLGHSPCLASHSSSPCMPTVQDGLRVMRTLTSVEAEQEVTVDYCGGGFLYQPTCRRRTKLLSGYEFVCDCTRCASSPSGGDDTRRFPCCRRGGLSTSPQGSGSGGGGSDSGVGGASQRGGLSTSPHGSGSGGGGSGDDSGVGGCCQRGGGGSLLLMSPRGGGGSSGGDSGGESRCVGYHLVQQLDVGDAALLLPCSSCGHVASAAACAELLDDEAELLARLDRVDATRELRLARVLQPPHPHHAAAARIGMLQWELFHRTPGMCDAQAAARAAGEAIACLEAIRPLPSKDHAAAYLALGDSLLRGARMGGAVAPHRLLAQAQEAYQKGVRTLVLLYGPSHPSSEAAARALAAAQCSMLTVNAAAMEGFAAVAEEDAGCSFCGGAMLDGKALLHCQVCQVAAYCCEEHRRAQWALHEKSCRAPD